MYVESITGRSLALESSTEHAVILLQQGGTVERLETLFGTLEWLLRVVTEAWSWLVHTLPVLFLRAFDISSAWTFHAFWRAYFFVRTNPHPFHLLGWTLFFGPIILLVPLLLLLELLILFLFHLSFLSHGLVLGSVEHRFDTLKEYFMDWREGIFATIELWTAAFNKWTTEYPLLLILRLIGGGMSLFIIIGLYTGWR